jgi:predicted short-subunit dehydrogenase-like oxidoreductase (DUF2520 family)
MTNTHKIAIIGTGNVAFHLTRFFQNKGVIIDCVYGRNRKILEEFEHTFNLSISADLSRIQPDTLAIVCVTDSAIPEVLHRIPKNVKTAYTSGSMNISALPKDRTLGVFYPLQTFSKGLALSPDNIPFFLEANDVDFEKELIELAKLISKHAHKATSEDRYHLHLAAVMSNNFVNHLFHLSEKYLNAHQLSFDYLKPLINETVRKIELASPTKTQTGPAKRKDTLIIEKHLASLSGLEKEVYSILTRSIQQLNTTNEDEL